MKTREQILEDFVKEILLLDQEKKLSIEETYRQIVLGAKELTEDKEDGK